MSLMDGPSTFVYLDRIREDALIKILEITNPDEKISNLKNYNAESLEYYSWPQMWGDTTLGFGGIGGQAFCRAQIDIFLDSPSHIYIVYCNGRHLYTVNINNLNDEEKKKFNECFINKHMPGRYDLKNYFTATYDKK